MALQAEDMRRAFFTEALAMSVHSDPTPFYEAFEDGEDALEAFLTALWEALCRQKGVALSECSFFPVIESYILEDTEEGFAALVTVTLEKTATASAVSGAIVFGSAMDPRVFAALPTMLKNGPTLALSECRQDGSETPIGVLHQGCDNDLQLFDPPTPQKRDPDKPLAVPRRAAAFVDAVVCWCMEHD